MEKSQHELNGPPNHAGGPDCDLIVIGGGINGTGIARDAAERGLKALLLEKDDFGAGTSAYSSRLIHGGLRYLENFEFDLVHESLREREILLQNAPHLVHPLPMAIPIYADNRHPPWQIGLGLWLYDLLSGGKSLPGHKMFGREAFIRRFPMVSAEGLRGGTLYYDAQVDWPERLCVENALAAKESGNATVRNHCRVTDIRVEGRRVAGVTYQDELSGKKHEAGARVVINAAGPWVDSLIRLAVPAENQAVRRIGGTKGSHIIVKRFSGAPETALYVEARSDGRPFFILPWRQHYVLIGTTDIHFEGNPDDVAASRDEVAYLLSETNRVLPQADLSENDVLYAYCGVRPLPYARDQKAGKITRRHWIDDHAKDPDAPVSGLLSVIGGKLTTYRSLAQEAVDYAVHHYGLQPRRAQSTTRSQPLPGGAGIADWPNYQREHGESLSRKHDLSPKLVAGLLRLYGSRAGQVLALASGNTFLKQPLYPGSGVIGAQVVYAVRREMARTVEDVLLRRLGVGLDEDLGMPALEPVSMIMARELGWSDERMAAEQAGYRHYMKTRYQPA